MLLSVGSIGSWTSKMAESLVEQTGINNNSLVFPSPWIKGSYHCWCDKKGVCPGVNCMWYPEHSCIRTNHGDVLSRHFCLLYAIIGIWCFTTFFGDSKLSVVLRHAGRKLYFGSSCLKWFRITMPMLIFFLRSMLVSIGANRRSK